MCKIFGSLQCSFVTFKKSKLDAQHSMWDLSSPGIKPMPPGMETQPQPLDLRKVPSLFTLTFRIITTLWPGCSSRDGPPPLSPFHFMSFHDSGLFLFFNPSVDLGAPVYSPPCHRLFSWSIPTPAPRLSNNCLFLYWFFHPLHVPPVLSHCTLLPLHFILFETFPICMVIIHMLAVRLFVH